jgi:SPP1 family phage portal protein
VPLDLNAAQYAEVWLSGEKFRADMRHRNNYFIGKHRILERHEIYADSSAKTNRVVNWARYIVNRYVGLLTKTPIQVTAADEQQKDSQAAAAYEEVSTANNLPRVDARLLSKAFVAGYGVEHHGWDADTKMQRIDAGDPLEWGFLEDEMGDVVAAVRNVTVPAGTYCDGELLADPVEVMAAYDDKTIRVFERAKRASTEWSETETRDHFFSRVPVIRWAVNAEMASLITDPIIGLCDEYNEIFSSAGDDVRREVDALLKVTNCDPKWIIEHAKEIRENRTLPLGPDSDAGYIQRQSDIAPATAQLMRTRHGIHMMGEVPDVDEIAGATGATSGIALQLKFLPAVQHAQGMVPYIQANIRERIELINSRLELQQGKALIEDVNVIVQVALPVNRIEEWENIKALDGVVSHRKQLELLSDVDNPEQELKRMDQEASEIRTPEDAAAIMDARVETSAAATQADFEVLVTGLSQAIVDKLLAEQATLIGAGNG